MFDFLKTREGKVSKTKATSIVLVILPIVMGILSKNGIDIPEDVVKGIITSLVGLIGFFLRDAIKKETQPDIPRMASPRSTGYTSPPYRG